MKYIDNLGRGNCLYFSYAISLMYYLRAQPQTTITTVLGRFNLDEKKLNTLKKLLTTHKNAKQAFPTNAHHTIQSILGPACRTLASNSVKEEFMQNPMRSDLCTVAAYQLFHDVKHILPERYQQAVEVSDDEDDNYKAAELYKVETMSNAIKTYAQTIVTSIQIEFDTGWEQEKSKFDSNNERLGKIKLMDSIIQRKTIAFFQENDHFYLHEYINHLNTDTQWGSEETLFALHRKICGETSVYHAQTDFWTVTEETPIRLCVMRNNTPVSGQKNTTEQSDIVLNNRNDSHWISAIPSHYCQSTFLDTITNMAYVTNYNAWYPCADKPVMSRKPVEQTTVLLDNALKKINNSTLKADYKKVLLGLFKKHSDIIDLNTAEAKPGESDEAFAERLQTAETHQYLSK